MSVVVPTMEEFNGLVARVAKLEGPPPVGVPGDASGLQALRISDLLEICGPNFFPDGQDGAGANASASACIRGLASICDTSGMGMSPRLYGGPDTAFIQAVCQALPGTIFSSAVSWDLENSLANLLAMIANPALKGQLRVEGVNEPNNGRVQMGGQAVPVATCLSIQQRLWAAAHPAGVTVLGPSVVDTGSNSYLSDYMGASLATFREAMDWVPGHDYPNSGAPGRDMARRSDYLTSTIGRPSAITEYHGLLYNNVGYDPRPERAAYFEQLAAYYMVDSILLGPQHRLKLLQPWSMYDYNGFGMPVGLFKNFDPAQPSMSALVLQAMWQLCKDTSGASRRTFAPGKLAMTITPALPPSGRVVITQSQSTGRFHVWIGIEGDVFGGAVNNYTLGFAGARKRLREYWLTASPGQAQLARQDKANSNNLMVGLGNEFKLVLVDF